MHLRSGLKFVDWSNTEDGTILELQIFHLTSLLSLLLLHLTLWVQFLLMEHVLSCHFQIMLLLLQKLTFQMWCPFSRKFVKLSLHYSHCLPPTPASTKKLFKASLEISTHKVMDSGNHVQISFLLSYECHENLLEFWECAYFLWMLGVFVEERI
jgi:hypothetical protein